MRQAFLSSQAPYSWGYEDALSLAEFRRPSPTFLSFHFPTFLSPMKRFLIGLSAIATIVAVPVLTEAPATAGWREAGASLVQRLRRPEVKLKLKAAKKVVTRDKQGEAKVTWKGIGNGTVVQPGDTLRYQLSGRNVGEAAAANLVLNQAIPAQMSYVLNSTQNNAGMSTSYSINNGKTFSAKPTITVKQPDGTLATQPAPAELYSHIRWTAKSGFNPKGKLSASYEVKVR